MNKLFPIVLALLFFGYAFSGIYISYDFIATIKSEFKLSDTNLTITQDPERFESGSLTIGYETEDKRNKSIPIYFGASYDIIPMYNDGFESSFLNIYAKYITTTSENFKLWGLLGYSFPTGDMSDWSTGTSYGFGVKKNRIGISYIIHNTISPDQEDARLARLSISFSFLPKKGLGLGPRFE